MLTFMSNKVRALACLVAAGLLFQQGGLGLSRRADSSLTKLVPKVEPWKLIEAPKTYLPESLFEYIDGAAESYLSYDFRELLVAQFQKPGTEATLTLEVYDMGDVTNAFGIFGAERYPENPAIDIGDAGYLEGETLNFMAGRFYVKLLSFGLAGETAGVLKTFASKTAAAAGEKGGLPGILSCFPEENLVPRSEKYIKKNFMGYEFLGNGYEATYKVGQKDFQGFLVLADSRQDAEKRLGQLVDFLAKDKQTPEKTPSGYHVKNRYGQHLFIGQAGSVLCGAMRVPPGLEAAGEKCLKELAARVGRTRSPAP